MNLNYTYSIKNIDIEAGCFEITYYPENPNLLPQSFNTYLYEKDYRTIVDQNNNLIYNNQNEVPFSEHIDQTVKNAAPISQWRRQLLMIENLGELQSKA